MNKIKNFIKKYKTQLIWVGVTLAAGGLGTLLAGNYDVYKTVEKPPFSPPSWVFPVVWTLLYIIIGWAAGNIAASRDLDKGIAIKFYLVQLFINILWPVIFFRFEAAKFALFWLALLIIAVILTFLSFHRIDRKSAWLLLPYLAWCGFAFYLNLGIAALNS